MRLLADLATTTVEPYDDLFQEINTAQSIEALAADVKHRVVGTPIVDSSDLQRIDELEEEPCNQWNVTSGVLTYKGRIYVPKDDLLCNKVKSLFNDNVESGHFRALKTPEWVSQDFH